VRSARDPGAGAADPAIVRIAEEGLLVPGVPVLVMYSGGRDSTCLLHACMTIAGAVTAFHVNYGLRAEADADERHCAETCERLGVELSVHRPQPPPQSGNLQAWAREVRYGEAASEARTRRAILAVGHTADDQVETIVYRLISSPARRAVLGMRPRDGELVRPLLSLTRAETTAYCERHGLVWRDDATNDGDAYVRNRIRNELLPLIRELHPAAEQNLLTLAARLRDEGDVLDALVDSELDGGDRIALERLRRLPLSLSRLILQRLADGALGRPAPGTARRAEEILSLSNHAALDLPHGVRAVVRKGVVGFTPTPPLGVRRAARAGDGRPQ